jgi:hypothetical protein
MAIPLEFFKHTVASGLTLTFPPDTISFGEAETQEIAINGRTKGTITKVNLKKRQATLSAQGVTSPELALIQNQRDNNVRALLRGTEVTSDLVFGAFVIEDAILTDYTPSAPKTVDGITIYETIELVYTSMVYV